MPALKELSLENNPCSKEREALIRSVVKHLPGVKTLDGKVPVVGESSGEEEDHEEVLGLIGRQWVLEKARIMEVESGSGGKK